MSFKQLAMGLWIEAGNFKMLNTLCFSQIGRWVSEHRTETLHLKTEYFCFFNFFFFASWAKKQILELIFQFFYQYGYILFSVELNCSVTATEF